MDNHHQQHRRRLLIAITQGKPLPSCSVGTAFAARKSPGANPAPAKPLPWCRTWLRELNSPWVGGGRGTRRVSGQENTHHSVRTLWAGRSGSVPSQQDGAGALPAHGEQGAAVGRGHFLASSRGSRGSPRGNGQPQKIRFSSCWFPMAPWPPELHPRLV